MNKKSNAHFIGKGIIFCADKGTNFNCTSPFLETPHLNYIKKVKFICHNVK
jgi:hypothetical protein